ncbi:MAG TPA: hypothetical protein P5234_14735, partial [Thermoanaerobaculaceae bacterium]|nr:hypothetical protein [Thermoanaerobaculaceae bacterium]HRS17489.1 hypothetical protein [Thermoanaerobaculaceae bacterium]
MSAFEESSSSCRTDVRADVLLEKVGIQRSMLPRKTDRSSMRKVATQVPVKVAGVWGVGGFGHV